MEIGRGYVMEQVDLEKIVKPIVTWYQKNITLAKRTKSILYLDIRNYASTNKN